MNVITSPSQCIVCERYPTVATCPPPWMLQSNVAVHSGFLVATRSSRGYTPLVSGSSRLTFRTKPLDSSRHVAAPWILDRQVSNSCPTSSIDARINPIDDVTGAYFSPSNDTASSSGSRYRPAPPAGAYKLVAFAHATPTCADIPSDSNAETWGAEPSGSLRSG